MQTNHLSSFYSVDNLQKDILSRNRYSIIEQVIAVKDSLERQQHKLKSQKSKMEDLRRKIIQLEATEHQNNKIASQYRQKLFKLYNSQSMGVSLANLKEENFRQKSFNLQKRKQICSSMKVGLEQQLKRSQWIFQQRKKNRVRKIKQEQLSYEKQKRMRRQSDFQRRLNISREIKLQKNNGRQRLKRYEQFKLAQAKFNYDQKKRQLIRNHRQKLEQLNILQGKASQEQDLFRKTSSLTNHFNEEQSIYITGK